MVHISRRRLLYGTAAIGLLGSCGRPDRQPGIATPQQRHADISVWDAPGLPDVRVSSSVTVTYGHGVEGLPQFPGDAVDPRELGGTLFLQICGDDLDAVRDAATRIRPEGRLRWREQGFCNADRTNVLGFRKRFITNAKVANFGSVYANIEGHPGATGLTAFIVPLDSPGITRGPVADKMGYRACLGSELEFRDVAVPAENMVAGEGNGMVINIQQMNMARATVAALSTGVARGAFDQARAWCGERVQGGQPLYKHQFTARKLAEMTAKIDAARLLYLRAAQVADNEIPAPAYEPAVAKLFADQVSIEVAQEAMSLMGARGYLREYGMEKYVRESFGARIYEGTPEVLTLAITESLYANDDDDF